MDVFSLMDFQRQAEEAANRMTAQTPEDKAMLARLRELYPNDDARVLEEMDRLRGRGENLDKFDPEYFDRAYKPAMARLMESQTDALRDNESRMNQRGIASRGNFAKDIENPGNVSMPEEWGKSLIGREYANAFGRTMMEAQNQSIQNKLNSYTARLPEMEQANVRRGQTFDPLFGATVVGENERQANRLGYAANRGATDVGAFTRLSAAEMADTTGRRKSNSDIGVGLGGALISGGAQYLAAGNMPKK